MTVDLTGDTDEIATMLDLEGFSIHPELVERFPVQMLFNGTALPIDHSGDRVRIALGDIHDFDLIEELTAFSGFVLHPVQADAKEIKRCLREHFGVGGGTVSNLLDAENGIDDDATTDQPADESDDSASVVQLVNDLIVEGVKQNASDIHIEPAEDDQFEIRYRVDGRLHIQPTPPGIHRFRASIVSRLKIMANMNIAEKRVPQDGRLQLRVQNRQIDVRVSVIPMMGGEGIVMRLLDKSTNRVDLDSIALPSAIADDWNRLIRLPHGMILVAGPTGSGKTTTLYSSIAEVRAPDLKIITIEDPIEYNLSGVNQIQVHRKVGLDFASGLRSILRHDPDVVLIGEIRDAETAAIAVQASLTGHLVFCTLHTNDAPSACARLIDMGVEPYLAASTLQGVLAQRLVRKLCMQCRRRSSDERVLPSEFVNDPGFRPYEAVGCRACMHTGYSGRIAIFELMASDAGLRKMISAQADADTLRSYALEQGMQTLKQSGWQRVLAGETTIEEVARATILEF